jgi:hypothetical protein
VKVVTVRAGETLVSDGPFAATKEYIAGLDIFECSGPDEAIELEGKSPVARFLPFEVRQLPDGFRIGSGFGTFSDWDDSEGVPFLLATWVDDGEIATQDDPGLAEQYKVWQQGWDQLGMFVFGGPISPPASAVTLRTVDGELRTSAGSFLDAGGHVAAIDVVRALSWDDALALTAEHPLARRHAVELRSFYSGAA